MELWVAQLLSVRPGQSSIELIALPQKNLPVKCLSRSRHPIVGTLGSNSCVTPAVNFALCVNACIFACVWFVYACMHACVWLPCMVAVFFVIILNLKNSTCSLHLAGNFVNTALQTTQRYKAYLTRV